jgi:hypothetical protein
MCQLLALHHGRQHVHSINPVELSGKCEYVQESALIQQKVQLRALDTTVSSGNRARAVELCVRAHSRARARVPDSANPRRVARAKRNGGLCETYSCVSAVGIEPTLLRTSSLIEVYDKCVE